MLQHLEDPEVHNIKHPTNIDKAVHWQTLPPEKMVRRAALVDLTIRK